MKNQFKEELKVNLEEFTKSRNTKKIYENFVKSQEEQFLLFINYLNRYVNNLREKGIISPFLEFKARIKATNSALRNYERKALDDIFGIEFVCATDREIEILKSELEEVLMNYKEKIHNKENGYKAIHRSCVIRPQIIKILQEIARNEQKCEKNKEEFPVIEVQYKTIEVAYLATYGTASHEKYKDAKLPQIQALYDADCLTVGEHIPYMWVSDSNNDKVRELSTEEVLNRMYPSLILKKSRDIQAKEHDKKEEIEK